MAPFTRGRLRQATAIPYGESVTKLHACDLLEEGTRCPKCHAEILSDAIVYLHRGCSNLVCASCFETNLSQELHDDICLICQCNLSEPCATDILPNWRFTYTNFHVPAFSSPISTDTPGLLDPSAVRRELAEESMEWSPRLPAPNLAPSAREVPVTSFNPSFGTMPSPGRLLADLAYLRAELTEQNRTLDRVMGLRATSRDSPGITSTDRPRIPSIDSPRSPSTESPRSPSTDSPRSPRQSNINVPHPNFPIPQSQIVTDLRPTIPTILPYQTTTYPPSQINPMTLPTTHVVIDPHFVRKSQARTNNNAQYDNGTHPEQRPATPPPPYQSPPNPRNDTAEHTENINHGGQRPREPRPRRPTPFQNVGRPSPLQHVGRPNPFQHVGRPSGGNNPFGNSIRNPAFNHHVQGPKAERQTPQSHPPAAPRVPQRSRRRDESRSDSSQNQTRPPPTTYRETRPRKNHKRRSRNPGQNPLAGTPVPKTYSTYFNVKNPRGGRHG